MTDLKAELRRRVNAARTALPPAARAAADAAITERVLALPEVGSARTVAAYVALREEVATAQLLTALTGRGVRILLPVLRTDDGLDWAAYDGRLQPARRGTLAPPPGGRRVQLVDAGVALVPGVAFDASGRRLGRGGGSYDRALAARGAATLAVGLAYDEQVVDEVPTDAHDVPVDVVVTPTRVLRA